MSGSLPGVASQVVVRASGITLTGTAGVERATLNWTAEGTFTAFQYTFNDLGSTTSFGGWKSVNAASRSLVERTLTWTGRRFGVAIKFKLRGQLADGTWIQANEVTVTPLPPRVPGLLAIAGDREVTLDWTPVGGAPVTKYQYRQSDDGGTNWGAWTDASGTATTHTVTGLTAGTEYTFQVRLVSGSLPGVASQVVVRASGITLTGTAGVERATLNWTTTGTFTALQYTFNDLGSTSFGAWKSVNAASRGLEERTLTWFGRRFGVAIKFKLRGRLADNTWVESNTVEVTPLPPRVPGLLAIAGNREVTLDWTPVGGGPVTKYQYRQSDDGGTNWGAWTDASGTATTHTVTGLTAGTEYTFQVRLVSASLPGVASASVTATPVSPIKLTGTAGAQHVLLRWTASDTFTRFQYTFNNAGSARNFGTWTSAGDSLGISVFADTTSLTGRQFGIPILYKVRGQRADNSWVESNTVEVTPLPPRVGGLTATGGTGEATLSWIAATGPVTGYQYRQRSGGGSNWGDWTDASGTTPKHTVTGLTASTAYTFQVRIVAGTVQGAPSNAKTVTTKPPDHGVTVSRSTLTVTEGSSATYTVVLDTEPTAAVTVTVAKTAGGDPHLTASPSALTFTTGNWNTAQTVTVSAADDVDGIDGEATFTHSASGADYGSVVIDSVTATESDNDGPGVTVNPEALPVAEGSTASYTVVLDTQPSADVTVSLSASGDSDLTVSTTALTFTTADWNTAQTVTVSAAEDDDAAPGTATITHAAASTDGDYNGIAITIASVKATEDDNDTVGVTVTPKTLSVTEESTAAYTVVLDTLPTGTVTVMVAKTAGGDPHLTTSPAALTFTTANWDTAQTVTVSAADDDDPNHGTATIDHTASGAGEYAGVTIASVIATEADDDTPGVKLSTTALTVAEGSSANYTVALNTLPPGNVTVTLSRTGDSDLTVSPTKLTFTTDNWSTAQTATVSAAEDDDAADGEATIRNRASGSGYSGLTATLTATEDDNDTAGVTVSDSTLTVNENGSAKYTVVLNTRPTGTVRVAVAKQSGGDPSLTRSPTSLTFTVSNWSTPKTVTVRAANDVDSTNDTATFTHTASSSADSDYAGIAIASVEATEADDDTPGVRVSRTALTVSEGRSETYTVALNTLPTGSVTVTVQPSGDSDDDLTAAPTSLTFTTTDWNRAQTVTVSAADDGDAEDGTATFTNTPSGADYASVTGVIVTATEDDNDEAGVTVTPKTLRVSEGSSATYTVVLQTVPTAAVTVAVTKRSGGDDDLTVAPASLTFTTGNWNTAQTVTVSAAEDTDTANGAATIMHTATSTDSDYNDITIDSVRAREADNDAAANAAPTFTSGATFTVAENETAVGTVVATDSDAGDRITGYALTGGADRAQFSITSAGALTFDTAPDYESPADADTDNVYVVVVEATSGASGRARTATRTLTVTVTDVEVPSAPPAPAVSGETADSVTVSWTAPANPGSAITDYDVQYRAGTSGAWTDAGHSGTGLTVTLTGLTAGTRYQVQVRASNAEGPGAWSAAATGTTTAANAAPTFTSGAMFSVAENTTTVGTVVARDADEEDSITGYALTGGADRARFTITSAGALTFTSAPDYESPTDADTDNAYVVVVEATSGAGERARTATQTVTVAVTNVDEAAVERIERVAETVQPEVSRAMVSETLEVVTQRIERPRDGQAQASLGGRSSFSELLQSHEAALNGEVELDWRRVLGTSSFSLPLSETDQPGAGGGLEVWGRGAWRSLSGGSAGELTWKGEMLSAHLGADWRLRPELLAGVALSWHEGDVDYVDGTTRVEGTLRNRMTSVHPYLGWFPSEGSSLWMSAGYGRGTVVVEEAEVEGRHSGDSEMRMVGAGGRVRVLSSEGWLGGGTSSLDVKGEGWVARTEISGNGGMLADDTVDARRVRLALEGAHERRLASGSVLTPVLELGVRHDGGDGETGVGVEIGGGLRYADAVAGLSSEVRVRGLAAHQGALDEWGVSGTVRYAPGASGRGVSFSVSSSLGAPGSGTERLWEQGLGDDPLAVVEDDTATPSALRLESELGYGFPAMGGAGVLTPYGGFTFSGEDTRRYRLGVRLERSPALSLELKSERSETATDTDHGLFLKGTVRW